MTHSLSRRQLLKYSAALGVGLALPWEAPAREAAASVQIMQEALDPGRIPKFVDPMPSFVGNRADGTHALAVTMEEFQQKVLPQKVYNSLKAPYKAGTYVWGYAIHDGNRTYGPLFPGFTIEAQQGTPTLVKYINSLPFTKGGIGPVLQQYITVDQTIHWADPLMQMGSRDPYAGPPPVVPHLHGAEVLSDYDGGPDAWFTPDGRHGGAYRSVTPTDPNATIYSYPNCQEGTTLWFHDHTLGATRLNVYAGLAAFYFLRDGNDTGAANNPRALPAGPYEMEIVLQDRIFDTNGQLFFPDGSSEDGVNDAPPNPDVHPYWVPEFFGNVMVVNGKSWPYLEVEPRRYRFRLLDGSNARFYRLGLVGSKGKAGPSIFVIGSDGGLLDRAVLAQDRDEDNNKLLIAPGERYDLIVDFAGFEGQTLTLVNDANAPFPDGDDPGETTQVMQFRVDKRRAGADTSYNPAAQPPPPLRDPMVRLALDGQLAPGVQPDVKRQMTLVEIGTESGPLSPLVNNTRWGGRRADGKPIPGARNDGRGDYLTELPRVGSTELWEIINLTGDAHPIHLHLVQFQLINRQAFDAGEEGEGGYSTVYGAAFPGGEFIPEYGPPGNFRTPNADGALGGNPAVSPFLQGVPMPPEPQESGWKDTFIMRPGEVTRVIVRFAPQNIPAGGVRAGQNMYPFDPTSGPGYVWHCHIIDHEDNEMMRPYIPVK